MISVLENIANQNLVLSKNPIVDNLVQPLGEEALKHVSDQYGVLNHGSAGIDVLSDVIYDDQNVARRRERLNDRVAYEDAPYLTAFGKPCDPILQPLVCRENTTTTPMPGLIKMMRQKREAKLELLQSQDNIKQWLTGGEPKTPNYNSHKYKDEFDQSDVYLANSISKPLQSNVPVVHDFREEIEGTIERANAYAENVNADMLDNVQASVPIRRDVEEEVGKPYVSGVGGEDVVYVAPLQRRNGGERVAAEIYSYPSTSYSGNGNGSKQFLNRKEVRVNAKGVKHELKSKKMSYKRAKFDRRKAGNPGYSLRYDRRDDRNRYGDKFDRRAGKLDRKMQRNEWKMKLV